MLHSYYASQNESGLRPLWDPRDYFPDHKPNTCPPLEEPAAASGDELVGRAVAKIVGAVSYYEMWPPEGKEAAEKAVAKGMSGEHHDPPLTLDHIKEKIRTNSSAMHRGHT